MFFDLFHNHGCEPTKLVASHIFSRSLAGCLPPLFSRIWFLSFFWWNHLTIYTSKHLSTHCKVQIPNSGAGNASSGSKVKARILITGSVTDAEVWMGGRFWWHGGLGAALDKKKAWWIWDSHVKVNHQLKDLDSWLLRYLLKSHPFQLVKQPIQGPPQQSNLCSQIRFTPKIKACTPGFTHSPTHGHFFEALATLEVFQILVQNHLRVECAMVRSSQAFGRGSFPGWAEAHWEQRIISSPFLSNFHLKWTHINLPSFKLGQLQLCIFRSWWRINPMRIISWCCSPEECFEIRALHRSCSVQVADLHLQRGSGRIASTCNQHKA